MKLRVSMEDRRRGRKEGEGIFTWRWPLGVLLETLALTTNFVRRSFSVYGGSNHVIGLDRSFQFSVLIRMWSLPCLRARAVIERGRCMYIGPINYPVSVIGC